MSAYAAPLMLLIGLILGTAAAWLVRGREIARLQDGLGSVEAEREDAFQRSDSLARELQDERVARTRAEVVALRSAEIEEELGRVREERAEVLQAKVRIESAAAAQEKAHAEKLATLTALRGEIEKEMHAIANAALQGNQASFLLLAGQAFETHKQSAASLFEQKEQAIASLLSPMATALESYQKGLGGFERAHTVLASEVQKYGTQAQKLVNALQAAPKVPGRWGEMQLQNVIELAGLTDHIDYIQQQTIEGEDGRLRPDLLVRLPGERSLVVDVKTPLKAYLDAHEADGDESREAHLRRHSQQVRTHMKQLGAKRYWEALRPVTPDFVVMFIPGENFYRAALERDPALLEDGWRDRVLVASPTTLIGLAMTIGFDWRREKIAENARHVGELGRELYKRLATMGSHITQLGNSLRRTVEHYSSFVGSLEGSVMPHARRFRDLEVEGTYDALPDLRPVDILPRELRPGGDVLLTPTEIIPVVAGERPSAAD
ncbi:MAG TPA: DNA recombination protein RmuC [Stellaceae bacterium]|nr:DNA recombination protein RmuC [Stellaceae bacterium]